MNRKGMYQSKEWVQFSVLLMMLGLSLLIWFLVLACAPVVWAGERECWEGKVAGKDSGEVYPSRGECLRQGAAALSATCEIKGRDEETLTTQEKETRARCWQIFDLVQCVQVTCREEV